MVNPIDIRAALRPCPPRDGILLATAAQGRSSTVGAAETRAMGLNLIELEPGWVR